ncbi:MAG: transglycosylase domain-containing protein [Pseudomonadota bacterium]
MATFALEHGYVGRGVYGWEDAASYCFAKPPEELTLSDAATLIIHMRSPSRTWGNQAGDLLEQRNAFLLAMAENGDVTADAAAEAATHPLVHCGN